MGKVLEFEETNVIKRGGGDYDFPKLKLTNKGDIARILLLENPTYEFVHNLQHPVLEDGLPVMQTKQNKRGEDYKVHKMAFISRPICLGDEGILAENGIDPKNCPICAYAEANPDRMKAPERRFAMHVVKYNTKKNGELISPFGVQVLVWAFTNRYFDKIVELRKEWGDLRQRDLILTCENPDFAGYDIRIGANAAYLEDPKRTALVKETFVDDNKTPDLSIFCGRASEERFIKQDLLKVSQFWAAVDRAKNGTKAPEQQAQSLDSAIDKLLGDDEPGVTAPEPVAETTDTSDGTPSFEDILAGL